MVVKNKYVRLTFVLCLCLGGFWLLTRSSVPAPDSLLRQQAMQSLAPGGRPPGGGAVLVDEGVQILRKTAVFPTTVNLADIPSRPSPVDKLQQQYLDGKIDLAEQDRPVSESLFQAMVAESLRQKADPGVQNYQPQAIMGTLAVNSSFKSIDYTQSQQGVPPDPDIMVGHDHIVVGVNTSFQVFDKSGNSLVGPILYEDFWANAGGTCATGSSSVNMFDPFSAYDEEESRYILGITAYDSSLNGGDNGWACIAVSTSDSATGSWYLYSFDGNVGSGTDYFYDYPHLGVGQDALYLSANMFGSSFVRAHLHVLDKDAMYAGTTPTYWQINDTSDFTLQPAKLKGYNTGGWPTNASEPHYYAAVVWGSSTIRVKKVTLNASNPWGTAPSYATAGSVSVNSYSQPVSQPQSGGSNIEGNDYRLLDLEYWGGKLWATHTIGCNPGGGTVNCVRWYEIDISSGTPSLVQQGTFSSNSTYRSFPDLAVDKCGNMVVGYTSTSSSTFPSVYVAGREAGDTAGQLKQETLVHAGEAYYTAYDSVPRRWGDYTGMALDPDGVTHWYVGEYSRSQSTARWSTWVSGSKWSSCSVAPDFTLDVTPASANICASGSQQFNVALASLAGFNSSVSLSASGNPGTASFSPSSVTPTGSSTLTISGAAAGSHAFTVSGSGGSPTINRSADVTLNVAAAVPGAPTLSSPGGGETAVSTLPTFTWSNNSAAGYDIQVATDINFSNIVLSATDLPGNSYTAGSSLSNGTLYYWRVRGSNACGNSSWTAVSAFRTGSGQSCTNVLSEPGFEGGASGAWSSSSTLGQVLIDTNNPRSGSYAARLGRQNNENSQVWQTAAIASGATSATLRYWYDISSSDICGSFYDVGSVKVNGSAVSGHEYDLCSGTSTGGFVQSAAINMASYAGTTPEIRFQTTTDVSLLSTMTIDDVELMVCTIGSTPAADYSDLPLSYGVAWHEGSGSRKLGSSWDSDTTFSNGQDDGTDDGVTFPASWAQGETVNVTVTVQGGSGSLKGWVDWNNDGDFADGNELVIDQTVASAGDQVVAVDVPETAVLSTPLNYRIRFASSTIDSSSGSMADGEVTDGQTAGVSAPCAAPTAVSNLSISGNVGAGTVNLSWSNTNADSYEVRRSVGDFYFSNGLGTLLTTSSSGSYQDSTVALNNVGTHHVYQIRAVNGCGSASNSTHTVAEFEFDIMPGN